MVIVHLFPVGLGAEAPNKGGWVGISLIWQAKCVPCYGYSGGLQGYSIIALYLCQVQAERGVDKPLSYLYDENRITFYTVNLFLLYITSQSLSIQYTSGFH